MFKVFTSYITAKIDLSPDELALIRSLSIPRKLKKRQYLLQEGDVCRHAIFIAKGLFRNYRVSDDGTEHSLCFATENGWCTDWESYSEETPAKTNMVALEDSDVLLWTKANFERLIREIPAMGKFFESFVSKSLSIQQSRLYLHISQSTEEKYEYFVKNEPELHARVPLHMIASYLGVTRETLSRVRGMYVHK
jgi:CRP-like cAMP-binding protein